MPGGLGNRRDDTDDERFFKFGVHQLVVLVVVVVAVVIYNLVTHH